MPRRKSGHSRVGGSRMVHAGLGLAARVLLVSSICLVAVGRLDAAPYYTATYVGPVNEVMQQSGNVTNSQTGVSYPFLTTTTPITAADLQNLPEVTEGPTIDYPKPGPRPDMGRVHQ